jgi:hypothetical protein
MKASSRALVYRLPLALEGHSRLECLEFDGDLRNF